MSPNNLSKMIDNGQIIFRYCNDSGDIISISQIQMDQLITQLRCAMELKRFGYDAPS